MANIPTPAPGSSPKGRRRRSVPDWVVVVVGLVAVVLAGPAVFAIGDYYVAHTTVTVALVSWALPPVNGTSYGYLIECQGNCPTQAHPGSTYTGTVYIEGFRGNVTLEVPAPFALVSTDPTLPAPIPPTGLPLSIELKIPSSPGTYSFTGQIELS